MALQTWHKLWHNNETMVLVVLLDPFRGMEGVEELHSDPTATLPPKVWTRDQIWKMEIQNGVPERFRCGTIQKELN